MQYMFHYALSSNTGCCLLPDTVGKRVAGSIPLPELSAVPPVSEWFRSPSSPSSSHSPETHAGGELGTVNRV